MLQEFITQNYLIIELCTGIFKQSKGLGIYDS